MNPDMALKGSWLAVHTIRDDHHMKKINLLGYRGLQVHCVDAAGQVNRPMFS
jgi:hypothetical protein